MSVLVATDLDRTLIYSRKAIGLGNLPADVVCVEVHDGKQASFMTRTCATLLDALSRQCVLVPVTTRVPGQYQRVTLPGAPARFAIAANGGVIYADGIPDASWSTQVRRVLKDRFPLSSVWAYVAQVCRAEFTVKLRNADELFCYAIVHPHRLPTGFAEDVAGWAAERGWRTSLQGRKLYWVPEQLTKSAAVAEVARRAGAGTVLAAGDSLLDVDMLLAADRAIHPAHGELYERGWSAPRVTLTAARGAFAGEEIVRTLSGWVAG